MKQLRTKYGDLPLVLMAKLTWSLIFVVVTWAWAMPVQADPAWQVESGTATANQTGFTITNSGVVSKVYTLDFSGDPLLIYQLQGHDSATWTVTLSRPDGSDALNPRGCLVIDGMLHLDPRVVLSWSGVQDLKVTFAVTAGSLTLAEQEVAYFASDLIYPPNNVAVASLIGPSAIGFAWPKVAGAETYDVQYWPENEPGNITTLSVSGVCSVKPAALLAPGVWRWRVVAKHSGQVVETSHNYEFQQPSPPVQRAQFDPVSLTLQNTAALARAEIATSGIPFEQGKFFPGGNVQVSDGVEPLSVQYLPLGFWPDGSIKWALFTVDVEIDAETSQSLTLTAVEGLFPTATPMATVQGQNIVVDTGELVAEVPFYGLAPWGDITPNGASTRNLPLSIHVGAVLGPQETDPVVEFNSDSAETYIEENGPLRAVLCTQGELADATDSIGFGYTLRQEYHRDSRQVRLLLTLVCKTGTVVRGGTIPTVLLDHIKVSIGNVDAQVIYFGPTEDLRFDRQNDRLILDQMTHYMFEIRTE